MRCTIATILFALAITAVGQPISNRYEEIGHLGVDRTQQKWPSPETIVGDLRSGDDQRRLRALELLGLSRQAHVTVWSEKQPSTVTGQVVAKADEVQLTYARIGDDDTEYAIVSVLIRGQMPFASVAVPLGRGSWKRIAVFYPGRYDWSLHEFVTLARAPEDYSQTKPQHFELVVRGSDGGTGLYLQNVGHFRVHNGKLRTVFSYESRRRNCPMTNPCELHVRYFKPAAVNGKHGGMLAESRGRYPQGCTDFASVAIDGLENRFLRPPRCRMYEWDESKYRYVANGAAVECSRQQSQ